MKTRAISHAVRAQHNNNNQEKKAKNYARVHSICFTSNDNKCGKAAYVDDFLHLNLIYIIFLQKIFLNYAVHVLYLILVYRFFSFYVRCPC